jgi:hypothetical protein
MQSRVGHGIGAELLEPAAGFIAGEAGRERDILNGRLRSDWAIHKGIVQDGRCLALILGELDGRPKNAKHSETM